jgi:hypothetical protein
MVDHFKIDGDHSSRVAVQLKRRGYVVHRLQPCMPALDIHQIGEDEENEGKTRDQFFTHFNSRSTVSR